MLIPAPGLGSNQHIVSRNASIVRHVRLIAVLADDKHVPQKVTVADPRSCISVEYSEFVIIGKISCDRAELPTNKYIVKIWCH